MRLWSFHPKYLDSKGLVALWREALLAQSVLNGKTRGYRNHPQLMRFKNSAAPCDAISVYLSAVYDEAAIRGYRFNSNKIINGCFDAKLTVTLGQLNYELQHLLNKLKYRDAALYHKWKVIRRIEPHPLFRKVVGDVEKWEKIVEVK